jgi:hypothetical protein
MESDLSYSEEPLIILDLKERCTRRKVVKMYKIQWNHHTKEEATWETEDYVQHHYPSFLKPTTGTSIPFQFIIQSRDEILFNGGRL